MTYQPHYHFVAFLVSAVVVLICTPLIREVGIRSGYVDQPGERKVHQRPMVRLGGVGIFLGTTLALLTVWGSGGFGTLPPEQSDEVWGVTIGGLACFVIGLADDLFNISPFTRLVMQSIVSIGAWQMGVQIKVLSIPLAGIFPLPMWISLPLTMLWLIGMINAINWIDGLDGLAAGVSGIAAVIMLMVCLFVNQPAAGIALLRTDHAGKDKGKSGQRGSSAKNDDVDLVYQMERTDGLIKLTRMFSRITWAPHEVELVEEQLDDQHPIRLRDTDRSFTTSQYELAQAILNAFPDIKPGTQKKPPGSSAHKSARQE